MDTHETKVKQWREVWFKNHQAELVKMVDGSDAITLLKWRDPERWAYGMFYLLHGNSLLIHGDVGEATYQWSQLIDLNFIDGCDFHYFHSKCQASEKGRHFNDWDGEKAMTDLSTYLIEEGLPADVIEQITESAEANSNFKEEWCNFLYSDPPHDFRDDDHTFADAGEVPSFQEVGHWVGIKMAVEQLRKGGKL